MGSGPDRCSDRRSGARATRRGQVPGVAQRARSALPVTVVCKKENEGSTRGGRGLPTADVRGYGRQCAWLDHSASRSQTASTTSPRAVSSELRSSGTTTIDTGTSSSSLRLRGIIAGERSPTASWTTTSTWCSRRRSPISHGMRQLNGVYAQRFNRRHDRVGHLFQGRYGARLVQAERYLLAVVRYVVCNPVVAGRCSSPRSGPSRAIAPRSGRLRTALRMSRLCSRTSGSRRRTRGRATASSQKGWQTTLFPRTRSSSAKTRSSSERWRPSTRDREFPAATSGHRGRRSTSSSGRRGTLGRSRGLRPPGTRCASSPRTSGATHRPSVAASGGEGSAQRAGPDPPCCCSQSQPHSTTSRSTAERGWRRGSRDGSSPRRASSASISVRPSAASAR